jgi:hypothetical protein
VTAVARLVENGTARRHGAIHIHACLTGGRTARLAEGTDLRCLFDIHLVTISSETVSCRGSTMAGLKPAGGVQPSLHPSEPHRGKAMARNAENGGIRDGSLLRIAAWSSAAVMLLLPLFAMQVTGEVDWDVADFAILAAMLGAAGCTYELAARKAANTAYRAAVGIALVAVFILIWMNLAVGIIGGEDNPANVMYGGVLAVGIVGAIIVRFQPQGMARALVATALAQALVALIALIAGLGSAEANWPGVVITVTGFFTALWLASAWLFRKAAREQTTLS